MIHAYSDSGTHTGAHENISVATSLFLTDDMYLNTVTKVYYNTESTTEGELLGICQSMEFITTQYPKEKYIEIITDSESLVYAYRKYLAGVPIKRSAKYYKRWKKLLELSKGKKVKVSHIASHQEEHNPNKVCDLIASATLAKMR